MPSPTINDRISFKNYLRANKRKFTSGVQTCVLGQIQDSILTISSGIDTSQVTRVIIFDDGEMVGLSTVLNERQLFYVPALPNDSIIVGVGSDGDVGIKSYRGYKLTFVGDGQGVRYGNTTYGLNSTIGLGTDVSLTILGLGGGLFLPGDPPTYSITPSSTSIYEGNTVSFAVTTTNVGVGTVLYYNIVGSASSTDFVGDSLTGSFPIEGISNNVGFATFTKTLKIDTDYTEGVEGFKVNILTGAADGTGSLVATSSTVYVVNVPKITAGSKITPSTFVMSIGSGSVYDDGQYNLLWSGSNVNSSIPGVVLSQSSYVGNVFYEQNIAILTVVPNSLVTSSTVGTLPTRSLTTNINNIQYKNNYIVYENFVKCTIKDYEFNASYNPTLLTGSTNNNDTLYDFATSSYFTPYVGAVGLYNDAQELLAIAKLAAPMPISSTTDTTFLITYDT